MLRFLYNTSHPFDKLSGPFSYLEYHNAESKIIYLEQRNYFGSEIESLHLKKPLSKRSPLLSFNPFLDDQGFIRIRPKKCANKYKLPWNVKYPIIIPDGPVARLLFEYQHSFLKHSGPSQVLNSLRDKYWILCARRIARTVQQSCFRCKRHNS